MQKSLPAEKLPESANLSAGNIPTDALEIKFCLT